MSLVRVVPAVLAAIVAIVPTGAGDWYGETDDGKVDVTYTYIDHRGREVTRKVKIDTKTETERFSAPACIIDTGAGTIGFDCGTNYVPVTWKCPDGRDTTLPVWVRTRTPPGPWSDWSIESWYRCAGDPDITDEITTAWASMTIDPNVIHVQPDQGWTLATVPTIFYVDTDPRRITTNIGGTNVIIRALPATYRWRWGDGSGPESTTRAGHPYPNQDLTHTYVHLEQEVTVRLNTLWIGQYSIDGGSTWRPAPGTATTDSTPVDLYVYNPHSHQVDCDLDGYCLTG